jgi:GGDEF domain-containing protein
MTDLVATSAALPARTSLTERGLDLVRAIHDTRFRKAEQLFEELVQLRNDAMEGTDLNDGARRTYEAGLRIAALNFGLDGDQPSMTVARRLMDEGALKIDITSDLARLRERSYTWWFRDEGRFEHLERFVAEVARTLGPENVRKAQIGPKERRMMEHWASVRNTSSGCLEFPFAYRILKALLERESKEKPFGLIVFDVADPDPTGVHGADYANQVNWYVGKRLRSILRGSDVKCQYTPHTFVLYLLDTPGLAAERVAQCLHRELLKNSGPDDSISIRATFGVTAAHQPDEFEAINLVERGRDALAVAQRQNKAVHSEWTNW